MNYLNTFLLKRRKDRTTFQPMQDFFKVFFRNKLYPKMAHKI